MRNFIVLLMIAALTIIGCSDDQSTDPNHQDPDAGPTDDAGDDPDTGDDVDNGDDDSCVSNADCTGDDEYCNRPEGCDEPGICEEIPDDVGCGEAETPFCDCDGQTQVAPTTCIWQPYDHLGECEDEPAQCTSNADCDEDADEYCDRPIGCDEPGTCEPIPDDVGCGEAETPYCDCEGNLQVSPDTCIWEPQDHMEACEDEPTECYVNSDCDEASDEYCQRKPGCEEPGECRPVDEAYADGCDDAPTTYCDCDGETHTAPDSCIAEPYDHLGSCDDDLEPGECLRNEDCNEGAGEYCDRPDGCEERGSCEPIPDEICLDVITHYCDCDGQTKTSPNSCIYEPIQHTGECEE